MGRLILIVYVLSATAALLALKKSTLHELPISFSDNRLQLNLNAYFIVGMLFYAFSFLSYMYLISKNDLGFIIPFAAAFVYIILFTASYFIFNEVFTATKLLGIGLIMVGIIFLNTHK